MIGSGSQTIAVLHGQAGQVAVIDGVTPGALGLTPGWNGVEWG